MITSLIFHFLLSPSWRIFPLIKINEVSFPSSRCGALLLVWFMKLQVHEYEVVLSIIYFIAA